MMKKIVILGGGITGLAAATHLADAGYDITILEKEAKTGGLAASLQWKNPVMDHGAFICYPRIKTCMLPPLAACRR